MVGCDSVVPLQTFQEDWIAEQGKSAAAEAAKAPQQPTFSQQRAATRDTNFGPAPSEQQQEEAPDIVRPGRLLTTLHAMRQELEVQLVASGVWCAAAASCMMDALLSTQKASSTPAKRCYCVCVYRHAAGQHVVIKLVVH
jgi:hypothetical protein